MKKLNKKGFTLIELLVTIALMLSILGIAIVSFITISNNRKKQAWDLVKGQIETAAKEYFTSNEYLFEGLSGNTVGYISVGNLVNDDYLNVVTDPRTGQKVSECSLVEISKNANKITATYNEGEGENCNNKNAVYTAEVGAPEISTTETCTYGNQIKDKAAGKKWCKTDKKIELTITGNGSKNADVSLDYKNGDKCTYSNIDNTVTCSDGIRDVEITVTNSAGKTAKKTITDVYVDATKPKTPTINVDGTLGTNSWYKEKDVTMNSNTGTCLNISGCILQKSESQSSNYKDVKSFEKNKSLSKESLYTIGDTTGTTRYSKVCSGAGLCSDPASKTVKVDTIPPEVEVLFSSPEPKYNSNMVSIVVRVWDIAGSGVNGINPSVPIATSPTFGFVGNNKSYNYYNNNGNPYKCSDKLDGKTCRIKSSATDMAGNVGADDAGNYTVYKSERIISSIEFELDNASNGTYNGIKRGMGGTGPYSSKAKGYIFKKTTSGAQTHDYCGDEKNCPDKRGLNVTVGKHDSDVSYAASSCMNVSDFPRYFKYKIHWADGGSTDWIYVTLDEGKLTKEFSEVTYTYSTNKKAGVVIEIEDIKRLYRYGCNNSTTSTKINVNKCGKSTGNQPNVTTHRYQIRATARDITTNESQPSVESNTVTLYTKYFANCGY